MSMPARASGALERARDGARRTLHRARVLVRTWTGLVALVAVVLAGGLAMDALVPDLGTALEPYRLFFQLTLAGVVLYALQNEVGVPSYGLFAPMIVAFILVSAGPVWGLALFLNVFVASLLTYEAVEPLDLGTAPRVATMLAVACFATAGAMLLGDLGYLPANFSNATVTFPVVISAWYAERMATDVDERGWTVPAVQLLWTIGAIFAAFVVITSPLVGWYAGSPVAWALTIAAIGVLGSRSTVRLSEFVRFDGHVADNPVVGATAALEVRCYNAAASLARLLGADVERRSLGGVLPMKVRNQYIDEYNPEHARPAADRKALLKRRLNDLGVPAPGTYTVAGTPGDLAEVRAVLESRDQFVVKPSQGYGGEGVLIVTGRTSDGFGTNRGTMTADEVLGHVRRIVGGDYAGLEPSGDAIVEELLVPSPFFRSLAGAGVPDVRVLVFRGYPIMAMSRLPTAESGGAANLHLGGVGVGLDLADGSSTGAYQQTTDRELERHPDTGADLTDVTVPNWEAILDVAVRATAATGLGYAGVDVVLDDDDVPRVIEVNVRPGLGIQNTTGEGILERLRLVESLPRSFEYLPPEEKVTLARGWAAADWDVDVDPDPAEALADATEPWRGPADAPGQRAGGAAGAADGRAPSDGAALDAAAAAHRSRTAGATATEREDSGAPTEVSRDAG